MTTRLALIVVLAALATTTPRAAVRIAATPSDDARRSDRDSGQDVAPQTSLFRSESELVTVDVVVLDKHGAPVRDLAQTDFTIAEDGRPQVVRFFQPVVTRAAPQRPAQSGERSYGYSTNVGAQARPERSFVMFFDDVHLTEEQGQRAKIAIERFLNEEAGPGDLVSLVAPGRGLRWHARTSRRPGRVHQGPRLTTRRGPAGTRARGTSVITRRTESTSCRTNRWPSGSAVDSAITMCSVAIR